MKNQFRRKMAAFLAAVMFVTSVPVSAVAEDVAEPETPAVAAQTQSQPVGSRNVADLDLAGILTTCMSWFQHNRFWIEAKTAFLVSAHKEVLDRELEKLDKYFQYQI